MKINVRIETESGSRVSFDEYGFDLDLRGESVSIDGAGTWQELADFVGEVVEVIDPGSRVVPRNRDPGERVAQFPRDPRFRVPQKVLRHDN